MPTSTTPQETIAPPVLDEELWVMPDLSKPVPCQGLGHKANLYGHRAEEDGSVRIIAPCCGYRRTLCASRVKELKGADIIHCHGCGRDSGGTKWRFLPM